MTALTWNESLALQHTQMDATHLEFVDLLAATDAALAGPDAPLLLRFQSRCMMPLFLRLGVVLLSLHHFSKMLTTFCASHQLVVTQARSSAEDAAHTLLGLSSASYSISGCM